MRPLRATALLVVLATLGVLAVELPEIRRYLRIRSL
jgi:hypothetical protein